MSPRKAPASCCMLKNQTLDETTLHRPDNTTLGRIAPLISHIAYFVLRIVSKLENCVGKLHGSIVLFSSVALMGCRSDLKRRDPTSSRLSLMTPLMTPSL